MNVRSEKCISICSDSPAALKALWAATTMSPLVWQCPRELNDISTHHSVGPFGISEHSGIRRNEIAQELTRDGSVHQSVGPELVSGISGQNIKKKIKCWLVNQHMSTWQSYQHSETCSRIDFGP
jgi:hypothetical protein